jgi:hypothetical protein
MVFRFLPFQQEASIKVRRLLVASKGKIAALVADAFQEEEYFFPKVALNEGGYQVEVVFLAQGAGRDL